MTSKVVTARAMYEEAKRVLEAHPMAQQEIFTLEPPDAPCWELRARLLTERIADRGPEEVKQPDRFRLDLANGDRVLCKTCGGDAFVSKYEPGLVSRFMYACCGCGAWRWGGDATAKSRPVRISDTTKSRGLTRGA